VSTKLKDLENLKIKKDVEVDKLKNQIKNNERIIQDLNEKQNS